MSEISNDKLFEVLCELKQDVGKLVAQSETHTAWMTKHVADDKVMADDIAHIQRAMARQAGAVKVWGLVATGAAGLVSTLFGLFHRH